MVRLKDDCFGGYTEDAAGPYEVPDEVWGRYCDALEEWEDSQAELENYLLEEEVGNGRG